MNRRTLLASLATIALAARARAAPPAITLDRFSVTIVGSGPDLILVPCVTCGRSVWNPLVAALAGAHRIHLVQVAGFDGEPPRGNVQGPVVAGGADGIAAYIATCNLHKPALIGHSMGGTIGLMIAARHPDALGRLMVVDMFPALAAVMLRPGATPQEIHATAAAIGMGMAHQDDAAYRKSLDQTLSGMILTPAARPEIARQGMASDHGVAGRSMQELIETDLTPELPRITIPVTILHAWNAKDPYTGAQSDALYQRVYAKLADARLVRIDNSAHFVFLDQPERFQAAVTTFLA